MTFDKFHLAAKLGEAVDAVRRAEVTTRPELKHTRWLWLKNFSNLSVKQKAELHQLMRPSTKLATARALRWREDFQAFYDQDPSYAPEYLRRWCYGAKRSRPGRQGPRPRLPQQKQDDHHRLPHHDQAPAPHPHQPHTRLHVITLSNLLRILTLSNPLETAKSLTIPTVDPG